MQAQISKLQADNKAASEKYAADLAAIRLDAALDTAIARERGRSAKAIKALVDTSKLKLTDDGSIEGLDLEALKKSDPYLFEQVQTTNVGTGGTPSGAQGGGSPAEPPEEYDDYVKWRAGK